jgi:hypothetical protein
MVERLRLRARDVADMDVIAALLQDALVPTGDMAFLRRERRFVLLVNRFMWEHASGAGQPRPADDDPAFGDARFEDAGEEGAAAARYWRTHTGLAIDRVQAVASRNLPRPGGEGATADQRLLNLLTIATEPRRIVFHFSGGPQLRLEVSDIRCHLEDLGDPWPTAARPDHGAAETAPQTVAAWTEPGSGVK